MKRTPNLSALAALTVILASGFAEAQAPAQTNLQTVPQKSAPTQTKAAATQPQAAPAQTVPEQPAAPGQQPAQVQKPVPAEAAPPAVEQQTVVAPELLIGRWDIDVDSYIDAQLAIRGKYEHPAKVAYARNLLKSTGTSLRFEFDADGCASVIKNYCGDCEAKKGSWCVTCVEDREMTVELRGPHGISRKKMLVEVCDDLHIRVVAPKEVAGVYTRVPDSVQPVSTNPQLGAGRTDALPPEPPPAGAYEEKPTQGKNIKADKVAPQKTAPARVNSQKPVLGPVTDEIAP